MDLQLSENSLKVLRKRYLLKDDKGVICETPEQLFRRVAKNIAKADAFYDQNADLQATADEFFSLMASLDFLPNSPTLMNAGSRLQQLSGCFVLPIEDDTHSIYDTMKHTALIHRSGGGTGFNFSKLRPRGELVSSTKGIASGPVSFMQIYNASTEVIKQGSMRRGANMGILSVDHPDIIEFINCKKDSGAITNFNISVALTDVFMAALKNDAEYSLINPKGGAEVRSLKASEIFGKIVDGAWFNGEPGIIFLDRINADNTVPGAGKMESTNPCGEQPLLPYESCNLGSINIANFVEAGKINMHRLQKSIWTAVHFLDNVIDMNKFPLEQIEKATKDNRKIGLGVMGFADALVKLKISYNSNAGVQVAKQIMSFIKDEGRKASEELAKKRGNFYNFEKSIYPDIGLEYMRNATVTTIAPTGSIGMIADVSSGIEPLFSLVYVKSVLEKGGMLYVNKLFENVARQRGFYSEELMKKVSEAGSIQKIAEIPEDVKRIFVTAHDISPEWHIKMQAAFQEFTDNAVSKTINFPNSATKEDIRNAYLLAYESGCKGLTVYRDGSRENQVINIGKKCGSRPERMVRDRKTTMQGITSQIGTGCGSLFVTINEDDDGPFELFARLGRSGGCAASQTEAIGRLVSLAMRSGVSINDIVEQLKGIRCPSPLWQPDGLILSCPDAIAQAIGTYVGENGRLNTAVREASTLKNYIDDDAKKASKPVRGGNVVGICPDCSGPLIHSEGCSTCLNCGFSKCG